MNQNVLSSKKEVVSKITEQVNSHGAMVICEYRGLTVAEVTELRRALRAENVGFKVYKNTLVQRAVEQEGMNELEEYLVGPNALAFGKDDAVAPARILADFAKNHEALQIKAAYIEGKFLPKEEVMAVAKLPNREGMYSMLLACMKEPVAKVARVIQAVADAKGGDAAEEAAAE